jgi:DNA-binding NtrC family response regulator
MQYPLLLVFENSHRLTDLLRVQLSDREWVLREVNSLAQSKQAVPAGARGVAVVALDGKNRGAWDLLAWLSEHRPSIAVVATLDQAHLDWAGAAWDLGVREVVAENRIAVELAAVVKYSFARKRNCFDDCSAASSR